MRKDAKIGFAIGGVLLAVLTVYVIVVPPRHHAISPNAVTLSTPTDSTPSADTTTTMPPASGSTTPDNSPPAPALAHNSSDGVNWERLLNGGSGPADEAPALMTVTPAGNGVTVPAPQPAAGANTAPPITLASSTPTTKPSAPVAMVIDPPVTHPVAAVVPVATSKTQPREYTIKSGQTLSSIAGEVYGNSRFYVAILRANPHLDPTHLKVGVKIILPDASEVNPATSPAAAQASATKVTGRSYTVKAGDTLYAISKDLFGTPRQADAIYELNKTTIGPNEARLKQGMVLKLPDAATSPTAAAR